MKTNLSSQISLHRVSPRYYRPENAFEKSVLTRLEKIPTDIYESVEEGANYIAREIKGRTFLCIGSSRRRFTQPRIYRAYPYA